MNKNLASDTESFDKLKNDVVKIAEVFQLLVNLVRANRWTVPKSNILNRAYHEAKDFLKKQGVKFDE